MCYYQLPCLFFFQCGLANTFDIFHSRIKYSLELLSTFLNLLFYFFSIWGFFVFSRRSCLSISLNKDVLSNRDLSPKIAFLTPIWQLSLPFWLQFVLLCVCWKNAWLCYCEQFINRTQNGHEIFLFANFNQKNQQSYKKIKKLYFHLLYIYIFIHLNVVSIHRKQCEAEN
jgi:hypothetical protein